MRVALYTACFGDHDQPVDVSGFGDGVDLFCFTDSPILARTLSSWNVQRRRARFKTARMDAKWYKMSASHLFPGYDHTIYVDASVRFHKTEGFVEHCIRSLGGRSLAFHSHPEGQRSLMEEAQFSLSMGKYVGEPLIEQIEHYARAGFPGGELLAGGCIVLDHRPNAAYDRDDAVSRFEKAWFDECVHWSAQDQLSLPYVLWKERIEYAVLPGSVYGNDYFSRVWSGPDR